MRLDVLVSSQHLRVGELFGACCLFRNGAIARQKGEPDAHDERASEIYITCSHIEPLFPKDVLNVKRCVHVVRGLVQVWSAY